MMQATAKKYGKLDKIGSGLRFKQDLWKVQISRCSTESFAMAVRLLQNMGVRGKIHLTACSGSL